MNKWDLAAENARLRHELRTIRKEAVELERGEIIDGLESDAAENIEISDGIQFSAKRIKWRGPVTDPATIRREAKAEERERIARHFDAKARDWRHKYWNSRAADDAEDVAETIRSLTDAEQEDDNDTE